MRLAFSPFWWQRGPWPQCEQAPTYGTLYAQDSLLTGHGDTILGYAAAFFLRTELRSIGAFTWTRTPPGQHGNVFVDCRFIATQGPSPWDAPGTAAVGPRVTEFARLPRNNSATRTATNYPHAEMVLIDTRVSGISPQGWGPVEEAPAFDGSQVRFWEHNTTDLDGRPVDASQRHPISWQLRLPQDAETIANYRRPAFVLGGWTPEIVR